MLYIYKHRPTHDMKAGVNEIRNSMKMRHSQKNCLKFVQNIEIIVEQKNQPRKHDSEADSVVNYYEEYVL